MRVIQTQPFNLHLQDNRSKQIIAELEKKTGTNHILCDHKESKVQHVHDSFVKQTAMARLLCVV